MAESVLRIGLVGATPVRSWGSRGHVPAYRVLSGVVLTAVCTAHTETATAAAQEFNVQEYYTDYHDLVRSPIVDIVSITTGIHLHHPIAKAALEAGKHVYCEWPLTVNALDATDLLQLATAKGVRHIVGLQSRFAPAFLHMKELLNEGYIGLPLTFHVHMFLSGALQPRPSARMNLARKGTGSSTLTNAGGHCIDLLCWLMGDIEAVAAQVSTQIGEWVTADTGERVAVTAPDNVGIVARLRNGAVGTVQVSNTTTEGGGLRLEVYGTQGKLAATAGGMLGWSLIRLFGARKGEHEAEFTIPERLKWVSDLSPESPAYNIAQLFCRFAEAIQTGVDLSPTFADAARMHQLLETIDRSSVTRGWVEL